MAAEDVASSIFCGAWKLRTYLPEQVSRYDAVTDTYTNSYGCVFRQLPQEFPLLAPLYTAAELKFNSLPFVNWAADNHHIAIGVCAAYLLFVAAGECTRKSRESWPVMMSKDVFKNLLAGWNFFLAVFSFVGFLRTMPHLIFYGAKHGLYSSICSPAEAAFGQGAVGFWVMLFIFSKVPELVDTIFLVANKKPVIFLHWYHHFTVLLYCERGDALSGRGLGINRLGLRLTPSHPPPPPPPTPQAGIHTARGRAQASILRR